MKIYIISSVRNATEDFRNILDMYADILENQGYEVYLPHRDTDQESTGLNICISNISAIKDADEIHIFYDNTSQGSHFDLGAAFALNKTIRVITNDKFDENKSFPRMLWEWQTSQK